MAPSEVRGGDAGPSNRDERGCDRGDLVQSPWSPRSEEKLERSPSPRGSDHSLPRAGARGAAWSCLAPAPTTSPERRPPRLPRDGKERREVVPLAKCLHRYGRSHSTTEGNLARFPPSQDPRVLASARASAAIGGGALRKCRF